MAAKQGKKTPVSDLFSLVIVLGGLACVSMAAYHYGPRPEALADTIDQFAGAPPEPQELANVDTMLEIAPLEAPPQLDTQVQPAAAFGPAEVAPPEELDTIRRDRLIAPLLQMGATQADVSPWGAGEKPLYRAVAVIPVGDPRAGLERRIDAVADNPQQAVSQILLQVQAEAAKQ